MESKYEAFLNEDNNEGRQSSSTPPTSNHPAATENTYCFGWFRRIFRGCNDSTNTISFVNTLMDGSFLIVKAPFKSFQTNLVYIPVYVHPFWFYFWIMATVMGLFTSFQHSFLSFILLGPILLCSVVIHELCHVAMNVYYGGTVPDKLLLWPLGGVPNVEIFNNDSGKIAAVAIAGPLSHIPQALFWVLMVVLTSIATDLHLLGHLGVVLCEDAFRLQVHLLIFNLLPVFPLDGSLLLFASSKYFCKCERKTALLTIAIIGAMGTSIMFLVSVSRLKYWCLAYLYMLYCCFKLWKGISPPPQPLQGEDSPSTSSYIPPTATSTMMKSGGSSEDYHRFTDDFSTV